MIYIHTYMYVCLRTMNVSLCVIGIGLTNLDNSMKLKYTHNGRSALVIRCKLTYRVFHLSMSMCVCVPRSCCFEMSSLYPIFDLESMKCCCDCVVGRISCILHSLQTVDIMLRLYELPLINSLKLYDVSFDALWGNSI